VIWSRLHVAVKSVRVADAPCSKWRETTSLFSHEDTQFLDDKTRPLTPKNRIPASVTAFLFAAASQNSSYELEKSNSSIHLDPLGVSGEGETFQALLGKRVADRTEAAEISFWDPRRAMRR
jgi:hypothetical protein